MTEMIGYDEMAPRLSWAAAVDALEAGHRRARAEVDDLFLGPSDATLLNRAAHIAGLGYGVKAVTVMSGNADRGLPTVQGGMFVFSPEDGHLSAVIDSRLVTEFKTAADSVLGARLLARADSRTLLIVGAGTVAASLVRAYPAVLSGLERILVWARDPAKAEAFRAAQEAAAVPVSVAPDLSAALDEADIVSTATMAREPVLHAAHVRPGTHVDLIGAFKADMREADDALISTGRLFVDSRATTLGHIGELTIPLANGVIGEADVLGDLYDLVGGASGRRDASDVTVFKNGGGAHLDLMIADYIARQK
ncbi:ornithine cyclodeaminase family protein [Tranquillimonas rosea]|uniref:ornithine cyclodeaminase family protein n=1 Tax=Tranquillimonas rosea TaxID=641238 RepID=UPI003BAC41C0